MSGLGCHASLCCPDLMCWELQLLRPQVSSMEVRVQTGLRGASLAPKNQVLQTLTLATENGDAPLVPALGRQRGR